MTVKHDKYRATKRRKVAALEVKAVGDGGTFEGYGSVFNTVDSDDEAIAKGAFAGSLAQHKTAGTLPAMLWQHDHMTPIGVYRKMAEDERGLYVEGELSLETQRGSEAHALLKMGALNGLSIGFMPVKWEFDAEAEIRTFTEIDLWEVSLVTFPANRDARVTGVKAAEVETIREFERFLRDEGFSVEAAKRIAAGGFKAWQPRDEAPGLSDLKGALEGALAKLTS